VRRFPDDPAPTHLVVMRLVVTRRVKGNVTPERKHKYVKALANLLRFVGAHTYTVDLCEVADVRRTT
jgi:hypothetical protein